MRTVLVLEPYTNLTQNKPLLGTVSFLRDEDGTQPSQGCSYTTMRTANEEVEIWKDVIGFEGYYQVSNHANVRRLLQKRVRLLRPVSYNGYLQVSLSKKSVKTNLHIHRLVALAFIPAIEGKPHINHINGIKTDNRIENLEWCTSSENLKHAIRTGLLVQSKGEKCGQSKLKEADVLNIRKLYSEGVKGPKELGEIYGVRRGTIWHIIYRNTWSHI